MESAVVFLSMVFQHSDVAILIPKVIELGNWHLGRRFELENGAVMIGISGSIEETRESHTSPFYCTRAEQEICLRIREWAVTGHRVCSHIDLRPPGSWTEGCSFLSVSHSTAFSHCASPQQPMKWGSGWVAGSQAKKEPDCDSGLSPGLVPEMQGWFNIWTRVALIQYFNRTKQKHPDIIPKAEENKL